MNIDIAYKGLKYLVAWGLFYFVIKYTMNDQFTDIDIVLIAAILTLILCVGEYVLYSKQNQNEHMENQNQNQNTVMSLSPSSLPSLAPPIAPTLPVDIAPIFDNKSTDSESSNQSSQSNQSTVSTNSSNSDQSIVSNDLIYNNNEIGIKNKDYVPPAASQPLNYNVSVTQDPRYTVQDYMGNDVKLDINAFGGTAIKQNNNDNTYPNTNPTNIESTGSPRSSTGAPDVISGNSAINQTIKDIKINLPTNGSGQQFVRLDNVVSSTIDESQNADGTTTTVHLQRHTQDGRPLRWYEQAFNPRSYEGAENLDQIAVSGGRTRNDILVNEMIYSDFNRMPPSFVEKDFEYGYSFLPPKDWYPLPPYPPVCSSNKTCLVQPIYTDNTTMDLKDWHETQKFGPPDSLNTSFITNELNSKI